MARKYEYKTAASRKNRELALILCIVGGWMGLHYFYVRRYWRGAINLFLLLALTISTNIYGISYSYRFFQPFSAGFIHWREAVAVLSAAALGVMWILDALCIIQHRFRDDRKLLLK